MALTSRLRYPYPDENLDPWYDSFASFTDAIDASLYTVREDRSVVLTGGGTISFAISGLDGTVAWTSTIDIVSPIAGLLLQVSPGSVALRDGEMLYAQMVRSPTVTQGISLTKTTQIPNTDNALLIAVRRENVLYWRNGRSIGDGESLSLFTSPGGAVTVQDAGAAVGSRPILNFIGAASVTDDAINNRIDVDVRDFTYEELVFGAFLTTMGSTSLELAGGSAWVALRHDASGAREVRLEVVLAATLVSNDVRVKLWSVADAAYVDPLKAPDPYLETDSLTPIRIVSDDLKTSTNFDETTTSIYEVHVQSTNAATRALLYSARLVVS